MNTNLWHFKTKNLIEYAYYISLKILSADIKKHNFKELSIEKQINIFEKECI